LLDTNIVLDVALQRQPFYPASLQLLNLIHQVKFEAFISASSITDIYYILRKAKGHDDTIEFLKIVTRLCQVASVDQTSIANALISTLDDFEDAVQVEIARANHLEVIATRNPQDFSVNDIQVLTPETLLQQLL
jgi:predicted nucleic acid-binding protein